MRKITLIATSIFGVEALVRSELEALNFKILATHDGRVEFEATLNDIPKANLWLRTADRVLLKVGEFRAEDFDQLFDTTKTFPWHQWITKNGKIDTLARCVKSRIRSARVCQSMVKKAIIENLQKEYKIQRFPENGPSFTVHTVIFKNISLLMIDTTGQGLHKRGYRMDKGKVPLKENLAAAMILFSNWNKKKPLIDPMCGSGTILIEAAMIARNIAPGLNREFISEQWPCIKKDSWDEARKQAQKAITQDDSLKINGYDIEKDRIQNSKKNAKRAGVSNTIVFEQKDISTFAIEEYSGIAITNPPYGIKLSDRKEVLKIYEALNSLFQDKTAWSVYILTADKQFARHFKRSRPNKVRRLYHGTLQVDFFQYKGIKRYYK